MDRQIIYYTCNTHPPEIDERCRAQLLRCGLPIVSVSLNRWLEFGEQYMTVAGQPSAEMMHTQIVFGLRMAEAPMVYLCENDVLYHPSHFQGTHPRDDVFYFNTHVYKRWEDGHTVWTDDLQQLSGLCGARELLLEFFTRRLKQIQTEGNNRHYEPGARYGCLTENWRSEFPNLDLRHGKNLTRSHRNAEDFRNKKYARGFRVVEAVPYWDEIGRGG